MRDMFRWVAAAAAVAMLSSTAVATAQPRIDPRATDQLKKMTDLLVHTKALTVHATFRNEVVTLSGQKLEYESWAHVSMRRPDRFRTSRHATLEDLDFYYDGKTATVFRKQPNLSAAEPTAPTLDAMMDLVRAHLDIDIPGSDLLYTDAYAGMVDGLTDALYVGIEDVEGVQTHHVAFRNADVDWQLWIQDGEKPLPVKYVITTKWATGAPNFDVVMTDWDLAPRLDDSVFTFVPPPGARQIDFRRPASLPGAIR